ncbi:hypothetical protein J6590_023918 [Homalodisca vitripennis]|nr:hypothetical protein J6590_023918 [Homalodisca vitripennis]
MDENSRFFRYSPLSISDLLYDIPAVYPAHARSNNSQLLIIQLSGDSSPSSRNNSHTPAVPPPAASSNRLHLDLPIKAWQTHYTHMF